MAEAALMVAGVELAGGIAEEGEATCSGVDGGGGGELILRGSADIVGADDDHAEVIAVVASRGEVVVKKPCGVRGSFWPRSKLGERFGQARVSFAIGFHGRCDGFHVREGVTFITADRGLIPFDFERWKIEKQHAERKNFPGRVFADHAHEDVVRFAAAGSCRVRSVADVDGQEGDVVTKIGAAELNFGGPVSSCAPNGWPAGGIRGERRLARAIEKNETLHELGASRGSEARERLGIARGEERLESSIVMRAGGGQKIAKRSGGRVRGGGGGRDGSLFRERTGFLGEDGGGETEACREEPLKISRASH